MTSKKAHQKKSTSKKKPDVVEAAAAPLPDQAGPYPDVQAPDARFPTLHDFLRTRGRVRDSENIELSIEASNLKLSFKIAGDSSKD